MCCAAFIAKYVLFLSNLVFCLGGLAIVGLGSYGVVQVKNVDESVEETISSETLVALSWVMAGVVIVGAVIVLISFCGCCGAVTENRCMLIFYAIIMAVLAAVKIYLAVTISGHLTKIQDVVENWLEELFYELKNHPAEISGAVFLVIEFTFNCCGTKGPHSYDEVLPNPPPTCCSRGIDDWETVCSKEEAIETGCISRISGYFETFGGAINTIFIVIIVVEVVAVVFSLFLSHSIKDKKRRY